MPFEAFLEQMFHPSEVNSPQKSLTKLNQLGGYDLFCKELMIQSDTISFQSSHNKKQHLLEYILLYLVTLSLCSKILLYTHDAIDKLHIVSESIGIIFLGVLVLWKKKRDQVHNIQCKQGHSHGSKLKYNVHRNGQELQIEQHELKQGDFVFISAPQVLVFDAILFEIQKNSSQDQSSFKYIVVNQKGVDPKRSETPKYSIKDAEYSSQLDPFLFRNSIIQQGSGWAVICLVGQRQTNERYNESIQHKWLGLSTTKSFARMVKVWIALPIILLGIEWMSIKEGNHYEQFLQLLSLVASLLLYLQYANENQMLWLIVRYFTQTQQGEDYKIKDQKIITKLEEIDMIAIQEDNFRQKINELSQLACSHDIKIITTKSSKMIESQFSFLADNIIFKDDRYLQLKNRLDLLVKSKFLLCSVQYFLEYYLPLLESMKFSVLFIPKCQLLPISTNPAAHTDKYNQIDQYITIKNRSNVLQTLINLQQRSRRMSRLRNCYISILFNSCLQLIIMILWGCRGCIIELNLNLLILYTTRNKSLQLFQDWKSVTHIKSTEKRHSWWSLNLALSFYYIFMMLEIHSSVDRQYLLFLFLMTNRLFRLQPLHPHLQHKKMRYFKRIGGIVGLMIVYACIGYYQRKKWELKGQWESVLLFPAIIWLYCTFL